jgi:predicted nucleic acid-binding protein
MKSMSERSFLDTNILVYTDDHDMPEKQTQALEIIAQMRRQGMGVLSTQVLQEYFVATTRKLSVSPIVARRKVELFARLNLVPVKLDQILGAIDLQRLHGFSFWNALIIRCALDGGCTRLFTEDLQHRQRIEGLVIVNPFH